MAVLNIPDGPPTWIQIFGCLEDAEVFCEDHNLEFIDNVSTSDQQE